MTKYCKGCGVLLQNEDENALGFLLSKMLSHSSLWRCDNQYAAGN